jgi:glycerol-3-phosphate acyltransferase PlsY
MDAAQVLVVIAGATASYLVGSAPFAYLAGKLLAGVDIRRVGSGNVGASNLGRAIGGAKGVAAFLAVFVLDVGKGLAAAWGLAAAARALTGLADPAGLIGILYGLLAILGHVFPVWLRFRGGKAVAASCGVMLALAPTEALMALGLWMAVLGVTRYISLASMLAALGLLAARVTVAGRPWEAHAAPLSLLMLLIAVLVIARHRSNVRRLIAGTEPKIGRRKKAPDDAG